MKEIIIDTLKDTLNLVPFLFIAFLIIELIEHRINKKHKEIVSKTGIISKFISALLGIFPQCGFSVMATNLYATRIISIGTLITIYLTTSDEMIPILLSEKVEGMIILKIILIKFVIGFMIGTIIDLILRKQEKERKFDNSLCDDDHCHCNENIFLSVLKHTFNTIIFIMIITFILNYLLDSGGIDLINKIFMKNSILQPFLTSIIGLIPNCGASIALTELYVNNAISFGSLIGGLLTGSGIAILVLFKQNKNIKENILILLIIYLVGLISGLIINIF